MARDRDTYGFANDAESERREQTRLETLARWRDPRTKRILDEIKVQPGWTCLEVGAGAGTVSRMLAERVAPDGVVWSTDIDLRFHLDPIAGIEVKHLDIVNDPLPEAMFDLVHARALLQHLPERDAVLDRLVAATKPGGWVIVEDSDFEVFESQPLPEPLATVARVMHAGGRARRGWDPNVGRRLLSMFAARGLVDLDVTGETWTMRGNHDSGEWWYLALEHVSDRLVDAGAVTREQFDGALALVRSPDFVMMSPLSIGVRGRVSPPPY
jgi:SAM-dependent methyltransferase